MIVKRAQIAAKSETTEGTAATLTDTDAFLASNVVWTPDTEIGKRPNVSSSLSQFAAVPGARKATLSFDVEIKGSGVKGTAPELGVPLKACGFSETVVSGASVTYLPASTGISSLTIALYNDGVIYKIWGARGDAKFKTEKGKPGIISFTFTGADYSVTDGSMLNSVTYDSTVPPAFLSASLLVDSYAALIGSAEFGLNNEVVLRDDVNTASGYKSAVIAGRDPSLTFDPEMVLVATYDWFGKLRSGNEGSMTMTLGATVGNICTITAPKVQYVKVGLSDKSGLRSLGIDCQLNRNAGDDELSIAFT